jgi:CheY-like chemotaxis protein
MITNRLPSRGQPLRALVVEDNAMIALDIESMLLANGTQTVLLATTVHEAIDHLDDLPPGLAILDFSLREGTSLEFARTLMGQAIPIIFVSGIAEPVALPQDLSAVPLVEKPFTQEALLEAIGKAMAAYTPPIGAKPGATSSGIPGL